VRQLGCLGRHVSRLFAFAFDMPRISFIRNTACSPLDQDIWSTLEQTNANDLIRPFGLQFGGESPDSQAGGHTNAGLITGKRLRISYHGARTVTGGTPFCFNDRSDANPFGCRMCFAGC
jgi:hypothetical protein